jgi:hypothetical protein
MAMGNSGVRRRFADETGLQRIYNFYGLAEQADSVFLEGNRVYLDPPNFANAIVRDPLVFWEQPVSAGLRGCGGIHASQVA